MRWRTVPMSLVLVPAFATACLAQPSRGMVVEVSCAQFAESNGDQVTVARSVHVDRGDELVVRLCANPSTGFAWEDAIISDKAVVSERSREFVPPGHTMAPGTAGVEQWVFEAVGSGTCTISLDYSRPWDGGEKGVWRFSLDVRVA